MNILIEPPPAPYPPPLERFIGAVPQIQLDANNRPQRARTYNLKKPTGRIANALADEIISNMPGNQREGIFRLIRRGEKFNYVGQKLSPKDIANALWRHMLKADPGMKIRYRQMNPKQKKMYKNLILNRRFGITLADVAKFDKKQSFRRRARAAGEYWFGDPRRVKSQGVNVLGQNRALGTNAAYKEWFAANKADDIARIYREAAREWLANGNAAPYHGYY